MKWDRDNESSDVEDRRGQADPGGGGGGVGVGLLFSLVSRFGIGGGLVVFGLIAGASYLLLPRGGADPGAPQQVAGHDEVRAFVGSVLDDAQAYWTETLARPGRRYERAHVVLYGGSTQTACGRGRAAAGPFYCPEDEKVYLDVTFFKELHDRFGASGDFAQAYVIAHELGHHVQNQLGTFARLGRRAQESGESGASVRLELQADCLAGVWAHDANRRGKLDPGDIGEALGAAAAVGDDKLQREATGTVRPESWTHGSAAERKKWFSRGYSAGQLEACDTFGAASP